MLASIQPFVLASFESHRMACVVVQERAGDQPGVVEKTRRTLETGSVTVADTVGVPTEVGEVSETTG